MGPSAAAAPELAPAGTNGGIGDEDDDDALDELLSKLLEGGQSAMDLGMDLDVFEGQEDVKQAPLAARSVSEPTVPGLGLPEHLRPPQQVRGCEGLNLTGKVRTQARSRVLPVLAALRRAYQMHFRTYLRSLVLLFLHASTHCLHCQLHSATCTASAPSCTHRSTHLEGQSSAAQCMSLQAHTCNACMHGCQDRVFKLCLELLLFTTA